jgi:hypothetical protein
LGELDGDFDINDLIQEKEQTKGQEGGWYSSIPIDIEKLSSYI